MLNVIASFYRPICETFRFALTPNTLTATFLLHAHLHDVLRASLKGWDIVVAAAQVEGHSR
jgi:hypothetical protein